MIKEETMKKRKKENIEKAANKIARKCYEFIEIKVSSSFYEYAENGEIIMENDEFAKATEEIMESYKISVDKTPKLSEQITELAYNKLEELINKSGWTLDFIENKSYIQPLDIEEEEED